MSLKESSLSNVLPSRQCNSLYVFGMFNCVRQLHPSEMPLPLFQGIVTRGPVKYLEIVGNVQ